MNAESLGALLRDWRIERDLTQAELAKAAGLSRKIIGSIELGDRRIDYEEVVPVCRALGRHVEELVLHWSRSSLEELQKIEREKFGSQDTRQTVEPDSASGASESGSIKEKIAEMAALFQEILLASQEDLIRKLQLQMGLPGGAPPSPPAAPKRPRSRVSRKGRVRARNRSIR